MIRRVSISALALWLGASAHAATLLVPSQYPDIQAALDAAKNGDTVLVAPGRYEITETLMINRINSNAPAKNLVLRSDAGPEQTVIAMQAGSGRKSVFILGDEGRTTTIEGFTLTGGTGFQVNASVAGGGIYAFPGANCVVKNCWIIGNRAVKGGGVFLRGSTVGFIDCRIEDNTAAEGAGIHAATEETPAGVPYFMNCTIARNRTDQYRSGIPLGGGVFCSQSLLFNACTISGNSAGRGGALYAVGGSPRFERCVITGNSAFVGGGALWLGNGTPGSATTINRSTIAGNWGRTVGGILAGSSRLVISNSIVWDNPNVSLQTTVGTTLLISSSCLQTEAPLPGPGNLNQDPLFCRWGAAAEVWVDSAAPGPGDGSEQSPFAALDSALSYSYALSKSSPCIGAGVGGIDLGAELGTCDEPGLSARTIHLRAGSYAVRGGTLVHNVSIRGAGADQTEVRGTIFGVRAGAALSALRIVGGHAGGVYVDTGADAQLSDLTIEGNVGVGVSLLKGSARLDACLVKGNEAGVRCDDASPALSRCRILDSDAAAVQRLAFGLFCSGASSPTLIECAISGNRGSAVICQGSTPVLLDCVLEGNAAPAEGAVAVTGGKAVLTRCRIAGNGPGPAVVCAAAAELSFIDSVVAANFATDSFPVLSVTDSALSVSGSALFDNLSDRAALLEAKGSRFELRRSTLAGNRSSLGVLSLEETSALAKETILWANDRAIVSLSGSTWEVDHSCVQGAEAPPGPGNINSDPLFCGWTGPAEVSVASQTALDAVLSASGLGLQTGSPCLGAGENGANLGADFGVCGGPGVPPKITLAPGEYGIGAGRVPPSATLRGAGASTVLHGSLLLFDGVSVENVSVQGGNRWAALVAPGAACRFEGSSLSGALLGGLYCATGSTATLDRCEVVGNPGGGVICREGAEANLSDCVLAGNSGRGGLFARKSAVRLSDCRIADNEDLQAESIGSGVTLLEGSSGVLTRCEILGNRSWALAVEDSSLKLDGCRVSENSDGVLTAHGPNGSLEVVDSEMSRNRGVVLQLGLGSGRALLRNSLVIENEAEQMVFQLNKTPLEVTSSTIAGNLSRGGAIVETTATPVDPPGRFENCILWNNLGPVFQGAPASLGLQVTFSCVQSESPWPGVGNINTDPRFCAWGEQAQVFVDSRGPADGDGSQEKPYPDIARIPRFQYSLSEASPCRGTGLNGSNMGADRGTCAGQASPTSLIRVAAGTYALPAGLWGAGASLEGAGPDLTLLEGTIRGVRTGARIAQATIAGGPVVIEIIGGQAPEIADSVIRLSRRLTGKNGGVGVYVIGASPTLTRCRIEEIPGIGVWAFGSRVTLVDMTLDRVGTGVEASTSAISAQRCRFSAAMTAMFVRDDSTADVVASTFVGNGPGAAVSVGILGVATLSNCLIVGNARDREGVIESNGATRLENCTLVGNRSLRFAAVTAPSGLTRLVNCVVWGNGSQPVHTPVEATYCLIEDTVPWPGSGNIIGDPRFRTLGVFDFSRRVDFIWDGAPVSFPDFVVQEGDYRLQGGTPAMDMGLMDGLAGTDLGGGPRVCGESVDLGAYELCSNGFRRGDGNQDGLLDISDPVVILGHLFLGEPASVPCRKSMDVDDTGVLDISDPISLLNFLFLAGASPPPPFEFCGSDPTADDISCSFFEGC